MGDQDSWDLEADHHPLQGLFELDLGACILPSLHRLELRKFCRRSKSFFLSFRLRLSSSFGLLLLFLIFLSYLLVQIVDGLTNGIALNLLAPSSSLLFENNLTGTIRFWKILHPELLHRDAEHSPLR